jgi:hypothetical protein
MVGMLFAASASAATVASITLTTPTKTLTVGSSETLKAVAKDSGGHALTGVTFTWTSSSTGVLTVTSKGVAKGVHPGSSTIKVASGGKSASVAITVTVASITLTTPSKMLKIGDQETLTAVAKDINGHAISGVTFTWKSSKPGIVSITSHGLATALDAGSSVITVSGGGKSATVTIKVPTPTSLTGVAAQGAPIAGVTVTLVDKLGATVSTTTGVDGTYALDTTGLKPPFLVSVQVDDTHILYSVSADADVASVVNISPLTDLIVRSWYSVQGISMDAAFADPVANPPPSILEVQLLSNVVVQVTALWLQQAGVDTSQFNPINSIFVADGTGVDHVLDQTTIDTGTGAITITDGTTLQDSSVSYDTGDHSVSVATSTTGPAGDSSSVTGTVAATTSDMQTALAGITTALDAFTNVVNTQGAALTANELKPFLDAGMVSEGLSKTLFADTTADEFRGKTLTFNILNIASLDAVNGVADVNFTATATQDSQSQTDSAEFFFKRQSDGSWRLYGDQRPAHLSISSEMRTNQGANPTTDGPDINVDVRPIKDAYTGISIDGSVFSNTALDKQGIDHRVYTPDPAVPGTTVTVDRDTFFANSGVLVDLVPAGTELTLTLTPTGGGDNKVFTVKTNAFTTEAISITNLSDSTLTPGANLGSPLHVVWTLPTTFAIAEVKLSGHVQTDPGQSDDIECEADSPILSPTSTSGDITLPATCSTLTPLGANLNVNVVGVNGEREIIIYEFQDP